MALLEDFVRDKKFDVRLVEKNLTRGVVDQSELDEVRNRLEDDAENAEWVSLDSFVDEDK